MDANEEQLKQCKPQPNITFQKGCAEKIDLPSSSLDLVTVATALHWCAHATLGLTLTHSACHDVLNLHSVSLCKMSKYYRMADAPRRLSWKLLWILVRPHCPVVASQESLERPGGCCTLDTP